MTEIRVYPEHDKIVITHEVDCEKDVIVDLIADYKEWTDEGYEYYRMPLSEFMDRIKAHVKL